MVVQLLALSPHSKKVLHAAIRCGICVCVLSRYFQGVFITLAGAVKAAWRWWRR